MKVTLKMKIRLPHHRYTKKEIEEERKKRGKSPSFNCVIPFNDMSFTEEVCMYKTMYFKPPVFVSAISYIIIDGIRFFIDPDGPNTFDTDKNEVLLNVTPSLTINTRYEKKRTEAIQGRIEEYLKSCGWTYLGDPDVEEDVEAFLTPHKKEE